MIYVTFRILGNPNPHLATHSARSLQQLLQEKFYATGSLYTGFVEFDDVIELRPERVPAQDEKGNFLDQAGNVVADNTGKFVEGKDMSHVGARIVPGIYFKRAFDAEGSSTTNIAVNCIQSINTIDSNITDLYTSKALPALREYEKEVSSIKVANKIEL